MGIIYITHKTLLTILASAVEVYRAEAYGCLLISPSGKNQVVDGAINYATAERKGYGEVYHSSKSEKCFRWVSKITNVVDGWHSHTYFGKQRLDATPTEEDIEETTRGHFDIIVALKRTRRKINTPYKECGKGLRKSLNGYRFHLRCWKRIDETKTKELKLRVGSKPKF